MEQIIAPTAVRRWMEGKMTKTVALEIMCHRCRMYEVCQGSGCTPKKVLEEEAKDE